MPSYEYKEGQSQLFGVIKRPLIALEMFSLKLGGWVSFEDVLADTGADICLLPRTMGYVLVDDITLGIHKKIRGVVPNTFPQGFIHHLKIRLNSKEFIAPVFIADSEDVTPIFGRVKAMDFFKAEFDGKITRLEEQ